jgi:hypothetical protein
MKLSGIAKISVLSVILIYVSLLCACAVKTDVKKTSISDLRGNLKYENVVFKEFCTTSNTSSYINELMQCQASAISYLKEKDLFQNVEIESGSSYEEPCLLVEVTLSGCKIVSTKRRVFTGAFSGRSYMTMDVRLIDSSSGELVAEKQLKGAPSAMGAAWSFGKSDRALPDKMGVLLGDFILGNVAEE